MNAQTTIHAIAHDDQTRVEHHERISRLETRVDSIDNTLADVRTDVRVLHKDMQANTVMTERVASDTADLVIFTRSVYGLGKFILWIGGAAAAIVALMQIVKG